MKFIYSLPLNYLIIILLSLIPKNAICSFPKENILSFFSNQLTQNHSKYQAGILREKLSSYNSSTENDKKRIISDFGLGNTDKEQEFADFLITHKHFLSKKPKIKELIKFFPHQLFFGNTSNENSFELSKEFETFLEEIEELYSEKHIEEFDKKHLFSEEANMNRLLIFETLLDPYNEELKEKLISVQGEKKKKNQFDFISQKQREMFQNHLDDFFFTQIQEKSDFLQPLLNVKTQIHQEHYDRQEAQFKKNEEELEKIKSKTGKVNSTNLYESLTNNTLNGPDEEEFHGNLSVLLSNLSEFESILSTHQLSLIDVEEHLSENLTNFFINVGNLLHLTNKSFPYLENLIDQVRFKSGLDQIPRNNTNPLLDSLKSKFSEKQYNHSFLQEDFDSALDTDLSNTTDTSECLSDNQKKAVKGAVSELSDLQASNQEDADGLLKKKEVKYGKAKSLMNFQLKMIIAIIKMIINAIVAIITGFFRIIVPPAILSFFSCPEASFKPVNLIHIINFDDKTEQLLQKIEAYPRFFETFAPEDASTFSYYMCAQGLFTSECSALWPTFNILPFIFTQPPFIVIPFLFMFPLLDWLQLLPGDMPMCFLCCIQVLLQCKGIKLSQIPQCGGLYNLDTLLRALFDIALLVFLGQSMVPGLCSYNPFIINMWMIPPRLMSEEEKMMRKAPKLKALLKKVEKDPSFAEPTESCSNKTQEEAPSPFGDVSSLPEEKPEDMRPEDLASIPIEALPEEGNDIPLPAPWSVREIEGDYEVEYWENKVRPENSVLDPFESQIVAGIDNKYDGLENVHKQEPNKKNNLENLGTEWEYPVGE